jgi:type I restriction enzyme, S subunit
MSANWSMVKLSNLLSQYTEYIDVPEPRTYPKLSVKLYGKGVVLDTPANGATLKMMRHQLAKSGQVILSEIWGKKGAVGFVPEEGEGALCTSHFFLFDIDKEKLDRRWLQAIFDANYLERQLDSEAKGTTGYAAVRPKTLLACEIPLPSLPEQRRIVARIEELAAKINEARTLRQQALDEAEALLKTARRVAFANSVGQTVELQQVCTAIIDNLHTNPQYADTGIPCIRSPDVGYGTLNLETALRTDEEEYRRRTVRGEPQTDDIVLVREGGGTGKCALVLPWHRFSLGQRVMMIRPDRERVSPKFFLHQLLSPFIQEHQIAPLSKGSASPHLNIAALKRFSFRLPTLSEQHRIVAQLDVVLAQVDALKKLQAKTASELDALLPSVLGKAFKGAL